ncbi:MAG: hypothetical protein IKT41_01675 [Clostridia bacterium]|nr:hypothetical protein [Clostridia bacterium]
MKNKDILELKNSAAIGNYLSFIQDIIARMASNSSNCKILVATILTIIITLLLGFNIYNDYWWITIIIIVYGFIADSYYLAFERNFRENYNEIIEKINNRKLSVKEIYVIKSKKGNCYCEFPIKVIKAMTSFSVWTYYITLGVICYIIKII